MDKYISGERTGFLPIFFRNISIQLHAFSRLRELAKLKGFSLANGFKFPIYLASTWFLADLSRYSPGREASVLFDNKAHGEYWRSPA
ncbi:MAG: hypothetical protein ACRDF4_09145, partial [Rhabdochlamydiaceae bacterium]